MENVLELGQKICSGAFEVKGLQMILHGKFFPNTNITHRVLVTGKRGAIYTGFKYANGRIEIDTKYNWAKTDSICPVQEGKYIYDAETKEKRESSSKRV